jgi:thermostable 8-oxoguanine DNA glycosylase
MMHLQASQIIRDGTGVSKRELALPPANSELLPGILWGKAEVLFTPAFWAATSWLTDQAPQKKAIPRKCFRREVIACLLGGYGISFELNQAAFLHLEEQGILEKDFPSSDEVTKALSSPMRIGNRLVRYRFPHQKGAYVAAALKELFSLDPSKFADLELRNRLLQLPGVGNKTASWIVRNWNGSDNVAIIDIHLSRAGLIMGLFNDQHNPDRDYLEMERRFLEFCRRISTPASTLDILIWETMRNSGRIGIQAARHAA